MGAEMTAKPTTDEARYAERRFDAVGEEELDTEILETLPYQYPDSDSVVEYHTGEFTSVCPWNGLPDFGRLTIRYRPGSRLVELKSLKYYLLSYRSVGILQEHAVNRVLRDLVELLEPRWMEVEAVFNERGGLGTRAVARYER